jgi:hypothetical protein
MAEMTFGPFAADLDRTERIARLRALRAIALTFARPHREFLNALTRAESDVSALAPALELLEALPALPKRRVLATYADLARLP